MWKQPVLSLDSDTDTPRKGPLAVPGEVVRSSLSPRDTLSASEKPAACRAGRGVPSPAHSPVKSLASQTQLYESPSRRRIALSQNNNFGDSEHTLVYEARVAESQSQKTAPYVEPCGTARSDKFSRQKTASPDGSRAAGHDGRRPQESLSIARVQDQTLAGESDSKGEGREVVGGVDCEYYQALLPNMSSQLTPASQSMASQTQQRYDKLTTFGPETLHRTVPFGQLHRAGSESGGRDLQSLPMADAGSDPAHGQTAVKTGLAAADLPKSLADASRGTATTTPEQVTQMSPKACRLAVSEQGMQETHNFSLSLEDQGRKRKEESIQEAAPPGEGPEQQRERREQPIASKGKAAQLEREKALMLTSPALDDLSSQDFRFAVPAGRAPTSAQACAAAPTCGDSKQVPKTGFISSTTVPAPAYPFTAMEEVLPTGASSAPTLLPDAPAPALSGSREASGDQAAIRVCEEGNEPGVIEAGAGSTTGGDSGMGATVLEVSGDVPGEGGSREAAAHQETGNLSERRDAVHGGRSGLDDMDDPSQEESPVSHADPNARFLRSAYCAIFSRLFVCSFFPGIRCIALTTRGGIQVLSHKHQGRSKALQKPQPPEHAQHSACSKQPAKESRGPPPTARSTNTTPKRKLKETAATACSSGLLPGAPAPAPGEAVETSCVECDTDTKQDAAAQKAARAQDGSRGTCADSSSVIVIEDVPGDASTIEPAQCSPGRRDMDGKMDDEVQDKGRGGAGSSKRAKGGGSTPGCCYKCAATKSVDWHAFYVDGLTMQICKTCRGYHKDNEIVNRALLPEEPEMQGDGDGEFGQPSHFRARRVQEQQGVNAHMTMDGSQIYANSQLSVSSSSHFKSNLISGRCSKCAATQSTGWYDDENQLPLSLCAMCHHKRSRAAESSPRKRMRSEGEGVVMFSTDTGGNAYGGNTGRGRTRSPWARGDRQRDAVSISAQDEDEDEDAGGGREAGYGQLMMSQAFGDDEAQTDEPDHDEFGPSSDEEGEGEEHKRGIFAGHSFLVTGVGVEEKRTLRERILSQGGQLVDCNSMEPGKEPDKLLLLTDAPCKTSNFLCGLAVGVCVVSTQWVADCLSSKQLCPIDSFRLDAAFDEKTRRRTKVPKHFGSSPMELHKRVLGSKRVAIIGNRPFQHDHILMVKFAGAEVVETTDDTLHYIICESSTKFRPTSSQINSAHKRNIPLVHSEWLCACVRQQTLVDVAAHRVAQLANGARIRLSFLQHAPQADAPATAQSDLVRVVLAGE